MKVYFTHQIPQIAEQKLLKEGFEVIVEQENITHKELIEKLKQIQPEVLVCLLTDNIDQEVIDASKNLKIIATYSVGFNHVDVYYAAQKGIHIIHTPGVLSNTVAEHTAGLICALVQKILPADKYCREGKFSGWEPLLFLGDDLRGKTLGVLGAGRIGTKVAQIMHHGFGMEIVYFDVKENPYLKQATDAKYLSLDEFWPSFDVLSIHVPLLDSTRGLINKETISQMKQGVYIVNTSRGPVIKESDLIEYLKLGHVKGAALDVFEHEPEIPEELIKMDNVILTPHIASASLQTREKMAEMVADGIIKLVRGETPENLLKLPIK